MAIGLHYGFYSFFVCDLRVLSDEPSVIWALEVSQAR